MSLDISVPTIPTTPEEITCATIEMYYNGIMASINAGLVLPAQALMTLNNQLKTLDNVILKDYLSLIDGIETELRNICGVSDALDFSIETNSSDTSFCEVLFQCEAFAELILNEDVRGMFVNLIPFVPESAKASLTSDYTVFSTWICKLSLDKILGTMTKLLGNKIYDLIDNLLAELTERFNIDDYIDEYISFIQSTGIFEFLDQLDSFAQCAFSICDFATTAEKSKSDLLESLGLIYDATTNEYSYDTESNPDMVSAQAKETLLQQKIVALKKVSEARNDVDPCVTFKTYFD